MYLRCKLSGISFLIDSGAHVSLIPLSFVSELPRTDCKDTLVAANNSSIEVYGKVVLSVQLEEGLTVHWQFIVAKISQPIIGLDFLNRHKLALFAHDRYLLHEETKQHISLITRLHVSALHSNVTTAVNNEKPVKTMHRIETTTNIPVSSRTRPLFAEKLTAAKTVFQKLLAKGVIRPSKSAWSSPLHMVLKANGSWRPCGDYRLLNNITVPDRYPLPRIENFTTNCRDCKIFSTLDLEAGYNQVAMHPDDIPKTAITTPFGLYEYCKMPFGLKNSAQTFQRFMNGILGQLPFVFSYVDDILIASRNESDHNVHLKTVLQILQNNGLTINKDKCKFHKKNLVFLGHTINANGIQPRTDKIEAFKKLSPPQDKHALQKFIGGLTYYIRFIPKLAILLKPFHELNCKLAKRKCKIDWTPDSIKHFDNVKTAVAQATSLAFPKDNADLQMFVDASDKGAGAFLQQITDKGPETLAFFSHHFNKAQLNYATFDKELTAIYLALRYFSHITAGRKLKVFTDHKPIVSGLFKRKDLVTARQQRYFAYISEFVDDIEHIRGEDNYVADNLSRINNISSGDFSLSKIKQAQETLPNKEKYSQIDYNGILLYVDKKRRIIVPNSLTYFIIKNIHEMAHASIAQTAAIIKKYFYWQSINSDIKHYIQRCNDCQSAKIHKYMSPMVERIHNPAVKLSHIHVDLVGPLPESHEYKHILTIIDRTTRWPTAYPLQDVRTDSILACFGDYIKQYGLPSQITSDNGGQFTSDKWTQFWTKYNVKLIHTAFYHPQSNGLVERLHRDLKTKLRALGPPHSWKDNLDTVILALRTEINSRLKASPAQLLYNQTIRVPGTPPTPNELSEQSFRTDKGYVSQDIFKATHVFLKNPRLTTALQKPYAGPYQVLQRNHNTFTISLPNRTAKFHISLLKPAYFVPKGEGMK